MSTTWLPPISRFTVIGLVKELLWKYVRVTASVELDGFAKFVIVNPPALRLLVIGFCTPEPAPPEALFWYVPSPHITPLGNVSVPCAVGNDKSAVSPP
jgi:hypothetical protein